MQAPPKRSGGGSTKPNRRGQQVSLDEAVFAAYGWKSDLSEEEILEKLLALNLERGKKEVVLSGLR